MSRPIVTRSHLLAGRWATLALVLLGAPGAARAADPPKWEKDNPIVPLPASPLGVDGKLSELPEPPTPERVRLGRWLFFDTRLSADRSISCATCHRPENAFSEPTPVSTGIGGKKGGRKAPSFVNQAFNIYPNFFWDGRAGSLEEQALGPIANPIEMGNTHDGMLATLRKVPGYAPYFKEAFGTPEITKERIAKAIADYERTRMSGGSIWDRWREAVDNGADSAAVAAALQPMCGGGRACGQGGACPCGQGGGGPGGGGGRGMGAGGGACPCGQGGMGHGPGFGRNHEEMLKLGHELFFGKAGCNQCHLGSNFSDSLFHNLGIGWDARKKVFADEGRSKISKKAEDRGAFKTPTLRDVSKHAPYMHDGSLATLMDVVLHYDKGGNPNPTLSPKIKPLQLTERERHALVHFMMSLDGEGYRDTAPASFPE